MGTVYILQSLINERYYIGSTDNLQRRLNEHSKGKSKYTKVTRPFKLVYFQVYPSLVEARKVEFRIKKLKSRSIIERIIREKFIRLGP